MTAVYLGARFSRRVEIIDTIVAPLERAGHVVTSSWLREAPGAPVLGAKDLLTDAALGRAKAQECIEDIDRADEVAILTLWPSSTGGFHVECGYALGHKPLTIVGPHLNVFHSLLEMKGHKVTHHPTLDGFLQAWAGEYATA